MCGRFYVPQQGENEVILRILEAADARAGRLNTEPVARGEVFPTQTVAALAKSRRGETEAFPMRWGFSTGRGQPLINARSETAAVRPMFSESYRLRRCLIPAAYYYEWDHTTTDRRARRRYALRPQEDGVVWLAGIYRFETGQTLPALTILTRAAAPEIAFIHDRMPVICPDSLKDQWLDREADPALVAQREQAMMFREDGLG